MDKDIITSEKDLSRNNTNHNPVMDTVENSEQTATNPTPRREPNIFDELSGFHTYEGQLNEGLQDALDLEKEYYTPQAGWGESSYDKEVKNKYQIEQGDLNDIRAEQQAGGTQLINGVGKMLGLAGTTLIDGTIGTLWGLGQGIVNAFSDDPNKTFWNGFVDNGISNAMRKTEEWFEKYMPNYRSTSESQLGMFASMGTANFWADQIKQMGFTVGTALGATVTGLATGGAGVMPKLFGSFGKILGMGTKGVNWMERLGLSFMSGFNETKNIVSGGLQDRFNEYNRDNFENYQNELKSLDETILNETYQRLLDMGYYKSKGEGIPAVIPRLEVFEQLKAQVISEYQSTFDEIKSRYEENSANPKARAVAAGSFELGVGTAFMTVMNMIGQNSVLPSPFTNAERMVQGSATNRIARAANFLTGKNKFSKNAFNEFKNISIPELALKKVSEGASEMIEEGGQDIVTDFATNYYGSDNIKSGKETTARLMDSFMTALGSNINGDTMWKDMQAAFLSTMIGTPIVNKGATQNGKQDRTFTWQGGVVQMIKDAKAEYAKSKETFDFIRSIIDSPERRAAFNLNVYANTQKEKMMEAAAASNEKEWRDHADNISLKAIEAFGSIGRLSDLRALTGDIKNISDEELEALAIGLSSKGEDGKYTSENGAADENGELITNTEEGKKKFKQDLIDNADKFKTMVDNWVNNFNRVDKLTGYQLDRDGLSMLTWGLTQADNWDGRIHSMMSIIKEKFPHVLNTIIDTLQQELDNNNKYEQELNSLIAEDKVSPSDELKKKIEDVKSKIDPDLNADTYKSVIQAYTKLRDLDLDTNQKGYWNQLIDDDTSMYDLTLDILKGIPMDKLYSDDKGDFLRLLDDIRKCNNSRHNAINVTNQLINNPEEIKRLRKSFLDKEENISLMDAQEQAYKEIKESKSPEGVKEALIKLYDELQDPEKVEKAVKNLRGKDSETDKLIDSFVEKMKEKQAIDAQNQGNQLENDRLPAVIDTQDNRQFIENCIKDLINYLQEKYKNSNKSLYRLTTREIADAFWEMLHQPTETGIAGVRTQEAIATPYGVPQNNETLQRIPTDMEFQVVVQKVKQLLKDLYNQAVERGDIDKKHGQVEFIVDDNGNTYYISNNTPVKLQETKPISITEENSLAKTQSDIATSTPVTIPFNGVEVYDDGIIDVEYEIVDETNQQAPPMSVEDTQSLGEYIETVTTELVQDELDISSEDGSIVIYDNNTVTPESQITYIEEINEEQLVLLEEQQKELQQASSPLALLEKNQEQERNNMGEVLSKLFTKETSSETSEIDKLSQSLDEAIKNKQAAVERLESLNQQAESLELAPAVPDASLSVSLNDIQAKISEERKHIEDLQKQIEDLQKSVKDKETKAKPKLDTDTSNSYLAVLTNISSLKYDGTDANNRYSEKLNTRNEKAMQFFKDSGGMEFVNSGKLAKMVNSNRSITPVYFKREADIEDTVFMYVKVKGEYQCIGYIDNTGKQGVLGYNILYPRQQKANGYYYDIDGNRHEENIAIVDSEGYSTPVDNDNYITLRNADGKVMAIGQFFNGLIYLTDDRTLSEIPVGTNDLKQSVRDGNVGFGYVRDANKIKSVTSNDVINNYRHLQPGTRVVTFTASDGTTNNIQILPNIPVSEWSNRSKQNSDGSDSYINAVNKALMSLSNGIANKETDTWNKLRELFNFFTGQNFDSSDKESITLLTYRYYNTSHGVEIYSEPRGVKGGANHFHIDVKDKDGEVMFNIIFCTDSLLNSAKQLGKDTDLGRLIATSIYKQIVNPKLHIQDKETGQWVTKDVKPENRLIFNINLNAAMLDKMSDADKKNYLASMSDYCETSARNLETQGTFTVSFQSRKDRTAKINLSTMKTGSALTQRAASQAYTEYPAINLSVLNKKVSLTILPETDDNGDYTNNFRLRRTEISGKENVGYYGYIYPKKQFCESIGIKGIENMRTPDFNIFVNKILSCLYDYNNKNANIALPTHTEYSVENGVMSIPEISVIIDLNTMQAYNSIDAFKNSVKLDNKQIKENSNVENTTKENSEIKQETKEEKKEELPDKKAEPLKLTGNTLGKAITGLSKRKGFGGIKRHKKGIANGTKIYVKEGKIKAKNFLLNNLSSFEREGVDKSILDYLGRYVEDDVTVEILSDDDFTKKYGSDTLGVCDGNKVYLRPSTSIDTIVHELSHAVTIKLTKRALKMENTEDSPIRTLISILNEIRQLRNDNPNIFKDTNVDYFLNQPDLNSQIDEMIGEIFGDKKLQQILKGQHISTKESTAENKPKSIINLIREFLRRLFRVFGANKQQLSNMISIFDEFKESVENLQNTKNNEFNEASLRFDIDQSELQSIKEKAIADGTFMKAPNGKPTNLNERQWLQVRTKSFKDWFGDWEKEARFTYNLYSEIGDRYLSDEERNKVIQDYNNGKDIIVYAASDDVNSLLKGNDFRKSSKGYDLNTQDGVLYTSFTLNYAKNYADIYANQGRDIEKIGLVKITLNKNNINNGVSFTDSEVRITSNDVIKRIEKVNEVKNLNKKQIHTRNWKNVSKVVDENGEPLVVYHGSTKKFTTFDTDKIGSTSGDMSGFYFTNDRDIAKQYYSKETGSTFGNLKLMFGIGGKSTMYDVFLKAFNPYIENFNNNRDTKGRENIIKNAKEQGYDAVILKNIIDGPSVVQDAYVVFNSNQIKSATDNVGTFSRENDDIRYRKAATEEEYKSMVEEMGLSRDKADAFIYNFMTKILNVNPRYKVNEKSDTLSYFYLDDPTIINQQGKARIENLFKKILGKSQGEYLPLNFDSREAFIKSIDESLADWGQSLIQRINSPFENSAYGDKSRTLRRIKLLQSLLKRDLDLSTFTEEEKEFIGSIEGKSKRNIGFAIQKLKRQLPVIEQQIERINFIHHAMLVQAKNRLLALHTIENIEDIIKDRLLREYDSYTIKDNTYNEKVLPNRKVVEAVKKVLEQKHRKGATILFDEKESRESNWNELYNRIVTSYPEYKELLDLFHKANPELKVVVGGNAEMTVQGSELGKFHPKSNTLYLTNESDIFTAIHELAHSATFYGMKGKSKEDAESFDSSINKFMDYIREYIKDIQANPALFSNSSVWGVSMPADIYGFTNASEFIAELFGNPSFQELLDTIPAMEESKFKSLLQQVWDMIAEFLNKVFGNNKLSKSALDQAKQLGYASMSLQEQHINLVYKQLEKYTNKAQPSISRVKTELDNKVAEFAEAVNKSIAETMTLNRYRKEVKEQQEVSKLNKDLNNFLKSLNFDVQVDLNNPSHFDAIAKTLRYKNDEELLNAAVDVLIDIPVKSKLIEILRNYIKPTGLANDEFVRNLYNSNYRDIFAEDINNSKKALKEFILNKYNENKESRFVRFIKNLINNIRSWVKGNDMFGYFEANHIFEMITSEVPQADFIKWVDPSGEVQKRIDSITVPQDVATILNNNQLASSLIREFNKDGLALGGSISIAADGYLARKSEGSLHDLDMVWTKKKTADESQKYLESNRDKFAKLGLYYATNSVGKYGVQIGDNTLGLVPFITTPVDSCEKITNGEFKFYRNGTLVCHYKDDKVISGDAEVIIVDFLSPNPNSKPVTRYYNDKKYLFNTYNGAMRFKYDMRRIKDVVDYINFFKKPVINDDVLTEYCNSTGISKDDFNKLSDSIKDLALKCKS